MTLTDGLTRRQFLKSSGLAAGVMAASQFDGLENLLAAEPVQQTQSGKDIGFLEALNDPKKRNQYIEQLVVREFGSEAHRYVDQFIYDHDTSKIRKRLGANKEQIFKDSEFIELIIYRYTQDRRFSGLPDTEKLIQIRKFMDTPQGSAEIIQILKKQSEAYDLDPTGLMAKTDQYIFDFGKNKKSTIYVFDNAFKSQSINMGIGVWDIKTSEELLLLHLRHEMRHAKQAFQGITLPNGLSITKETFKKINSNFLGNYISESQAHLEDMDYASQRFGRNSDAFRLAVVLAADGYNKAITNPQIARLSQEELKYFEAQNAMAQQYIRKYPELRAVTLQQK